MSYYYNIQQLYISTVYKIFSIDGDKKNFPSQATELLSQIFSKLFLLNLYTKIEYAFVCINMPQNIGPHQKSEGGGDQ